jgi:hypothetical protein
MIAKKINIEKQIKVKKIGKVVKVDRSFYFSKINFGTDIIADQRKLRDND